MPSSIDIARYRVRSLHKLREFFRTRGVLEVETPILSRGISLDCHIDVFSARFHPGGSPSATDAGENFFLQTSPEPHMKRLLCRGFPDIFQISKAFRNGEKGRVHNPEFTMLEWYRLNYSLEMLMEEAVEVCRLVAGPLPVARRTYREVFQKVLGADPLDLTSEGISKLPGVAERLPAGHVFASKSDALDFAMSQAVEPTFPAGCLTVIRDFPSEQAAQAQVLAEDSRLAHRFEIYGGVAGLRPAGSSPPAPGRVMELGNGYLELQDPEEYERRFDRENMKRSASGKPQLPKDRALLDDLKRGLPACAGVAMGLDRLLMLGLASGDIDGVLNFPWERA